QFADITVQVRTADALARNERMASLGRLMAGIAHEINTPIGNALMVSSAIDDRVRDLKSMLATGTLRRSAIEIGLANIAEAGDLTVRNLMRAGQLIQNFKQVAVDQTSEQRRKFQLASVLDDLRLTLMHRLRHAACDFTLHVDDGIGMDSYPGAIGQIVTNLVENSLLHAFDGRSDCSLKIVAHQLGDTVEILFSDNGSGIHRDVLPRIFDPFFTTKMGQGGTGLGLSILINLVRDLLGGDVKVDSQVGRGTDFHILLPLVAPGGA
ncbi:MAG TPA: HAMP domain-containing sensor histidine kinase, partial [Azospira sp.]|nr:HAMP domain-containing sensor histidine kinase [Azospira sp.]